MKLEKNQILTQFPPIVATLILVFYLQILQAQMQHLSSVMFLICILPPIIFIVYLDGKNETQKWLFFKQLYIIWLFELTLTIHEFLGFDRVDPVSRPLTSEFSL
jgi:hypothetical protein